MNAHVETEGEKREWLTTDDRKRVRKGRKIMEKKKNRTLLFTQEIQLRLKNKLLCSSH